jgi:CheY-like chemotaxis protein
VNDPAIEHTGPALIGQAAGLPYGTPAIVCWVPGEAEAANRLGVVRYLLKPITRESLLAALAELGIGVESILVVDDDAEVLQLFGRMLSRGERRYRLLRASSGQRALDLLRRRSPDVMLLDLVMPGMDGYELLRQKGEDPAIRSIPVIAVSAADPVRESLISNTLVLKRSGGLSLRDLLACLQMWSEVMTPTRVAAHPERPGNRAG